MLEEGGLAGLHTLLNRVHGTALSRAAGKALCCLTPFNKTKRSFNNRDSAS